MNVPRIYQGFIFATFALVAAFACIACEDEARMRQEALLAYEDGVAAYRKGNLDRAYTILSSNMYVATPIQDYHLYYAGHAALDSGRYKEARAAFTHITTMTNTLLAPLAQQYAAYAAFLQTDRAPKTLREMEYPTWLTAYVAEQGANDALAKGDTNIAHALLLFMITNYETPAAARLFETHFIARKDITFDTHRNRALSSRTLLALTRALSAGELHKIAYPYWTRLTKDGSPASLYRRGYAAYNADKKSDAKTHLAAYLKTEDKTHRAHAIYLLARMARGSEKTAYYRQYEREYPNGSDIDSAYLHIFSTLLDKGAYDEADAYLARLNRINPGSWGVEKELRKFLKTSFRKNQKKASAYAIAHLTKMLRGGYRYWIPVSYTLWSYEREGKKEESARLVEMILSSCKNPYFLKEALTFATREQVAAVRKANDTHFEDVKDAYREGAYEKALTSLHKIQFIDSIRDDRDSAFCEAVRTFAHSVFMLHPFYSNYMTRTNDRNAFLSFKDEFGAHGEKAAILFLMNDDKNALRELSFIETNVSDDTNIVQTNDDAGVAEREGFRAFLLYRMRERIYERQGNIVAYYSHTRNIHKAFDFPYGDNSEVFPDRFRHFRFPKYYSNVVVPITRRYGLPVEYVYAIIRQESAFNAGDTSWAGAQGLMQVMPATARFVNNKLPKPFRPLRSYDIEQNVTLGVFYLRDMLRDFDGNKVYAAAAYNAGPGNARKWLQRAGKETVYGFTRKYVTFLETEGYIEHVMENLHYYTRYYRAK